MRGGFQQLLNRVLMNAKQFIRLFKLNTKIMLSREDSEVWREIIKDYKVWDYEIVKKEILKMCAEIGIDKPRLYYIKAIRKKLMLKDSESFKKAEIAPNVKKALKSLFN